MTTHDANALDSVACNARCYELNDADRTEAVHASVDWREARDRIRARLGGVK